MKLVKDSDSGDNWRLIAAEELRQVATALEFEQLPKLSPSSVWRLIAAEELRQVATALEFEQLPKLSPSSVQDVIAQLRRTADGLMAGGKS